MFTYSTQSWFDDEDLNEEVADWLDVTLEKRLDVSEKKKKSSVQSQNESPVPGQSNDQREKSPVSDLQGTEEEENSIVSGHSEPTLAPEGDDLPLPMPTPSPAKRTSMGIKSKPVRFHEDTTLFPKSFLPHLRTSKITWLCYHLNVLRSQYRLYVHTIASSTATFRL